MDAIGRKRCAIAEGHIPSRSSFLDRALISHETACILNAGGSDAHVALTIFFADRDPVGPYQITVPARRTLHLRFNDLTEPSPVPRDTDFSSVFDSDVPISFNTHGSTHVMPRSACCPPRLTPNLKLASDHSGSKKFCFIPHKRKIFASSNTVSK